MSKRPEGGSSVKIALLFLLFVASVIGLSLGFRILQLSLRSIFDGKHQLTIAVVKTKEKPTDIVSISVFSFAPDTKKISALTITPELVKKPVGKKSLTQVLSIPLDSVVIVPGEKMQTLTKDAIQRELSTLIIPSIFWENNMTIFDILRLVVFTQSVPAYAVTDRQLAKREEDATIDKLSLLLFADRSFSKENMTITIINGANVLGLGNRLARYITNMGGNVVVVTTADGIAPQSKIQAKNIHAYSIKKLQKTLGFSVQEVQGNEISDIVVTIGKDSLSSLVF